ncbi:hypothetical protein Ami103574_04375 [Aminipila butyrica]|uniref:Uncharacterized protein n=1 Tax=Aminipila butyrica TaxID=433296 RepID=A0A858BRR9_9FIRM|nr:hypothetical protein [Aminipila butyrica]QIB68603.1 hypothetical protein Ami103574_04375 [Aminipila butyrica]
MTKQDLENLYQLTGEIQDIERQLSKLEEKGSKDYVGDTVRDYRSGQGIPITIRGYPERTYRRQRNLSRKYQAMVQAEKTKQRVVDNFKFEQVTYCKGLAGR